MSDEKRYFSHEFDEIYYYWNTEKISESDRHFLENLQSSNPKIKVIHDLPSDTNLIKPFLIPGFRSLVIIEDAESTMEVFRNRFISQIFLQYSNHFAISCLIVLQSATRNPRDFYYSTIIRNLNYLCLFNSIDRRFIQYLNGVFFLYDKKYLFKCLKILESFGDPYSFLGINLDHKSPIAKTHPVLIHMLSKYRMLIKK